MMKRYVLGCFSLIGAASFQGAFAAQKKLNEKDNTKRVHETTVGAGILLKRIAREVLIETGDPEKQSIYALLSDRRMSGLVAGYIGEMALTPERLPLYNTIPRGIVNPHSLCYLIAPTQLIWAIQRSLHQRDRLPANIGHGGSDVCTLLTTALKEQEVEEKGGAASSWKILFPVLSWLQKHAPDTYELAQGEALKPDTYGHAARVLEKYLIALNTQYRENELLEPCPTIRLFDGSKNYSAPIVQFMPEFEEDNTLMFTEEGMREVLKKLVYPPQIVRMCTAAGYMRTEVSYLPLSIKVGTIHGPVTYMLRGSLIYSRDSKHGTTLVRLNAQPHDRWFICDDATIAELDDEMTQEARLHNIIPIEHGLPSDIIYERQN